MKQVNLFVCEYCNTQYKDKDRAIECEKHHKRIKKIVSAKYRSINSCADGIPDYVTVEFEDGKQVKYKRD